MQRNLRSERITLWTKVRCLFSILESCQISQNLDLMKDKESKGFFSLFQRSKKKREQVRIFLCSIL